MSWMTDAVMAALLEKGLDSVRSSLARSVRQPQEALRLTFQEGCFADFAFGAQGMLR